MAPIRLGTRRNRSVCLHVAVRLGVLAAAFLDARAQFTCNPRMDDDIGKDPDFWCEHRARLELTASCDVHVSEIIHVPWGVGTESRILQLPPEQKLLEGSYSVAKWFDQTGEGFPATGEVTGEERDGYRWYRLTFHPAKSVKGTVERTDMNQVFRLDYVIVGSISQWYACPTDAQEIKNVVANSTINFVSWSPGGESTSTINYVEVLWYSLRGSPRTVDQAFLVAPESPSLRTQSIDFELNDLPAIRHEFYHVTEPSKLMSVAKTVTKETNLCLSTRSCQAFQQIALLTDVFSGDTSNQTPSHLVGAIAGGVAAFVAIAVVSSFFIAKRVKRKRALQTQNDEQLNLPSGIRHLAYDTGDEEEASGVVLALANAREESQGESGGTNWTSMQNSWANSGDSSGDGPRSAGIALGVAENTVNSRDSLEEISGPGCKQPASGKQVKSAKWREKDPAERADNSVSVMSLLRADFTVVESSIEGGSAQPKTPKSAGNGLW